MTPQQALKILRETELNWSSISSFRYNKQRWYANFILKEPASSPEMTFGSYIDKKIQEDPKFLPTLPRYELMQHKMTGVKFGKLKLKGTPDGIDLNKRKKILADYKTGRVAWTHKRAKEHGQFLMYLFLLYLTEQVKPEEFLCRIHWLPTKKTIKGIKTKIELVDDKFQTFEVTFTTVDMLNFAIYIKDTFKEMEEYVQKIIKYYFYIEKGLDLVNVFRNLFLAIFAGYVAMKFVNPLWALGMFAVSIPVLMVVGYYNVHHISKVRDRLNVKFGTHYGIKAFDYQKRTVELLEEINKKL